MTDPYEYRRYGFDVPSAHHRLSDPRTVADVQEIVSAAVDEALDAVQIGLPVAALNQVHSDASKYAIKSAWSRLPENVKRELAARSFYFTDAKEHALPGIVASAWANNVFVDPDTFDNYPLEAQQNIIGHELAHSYLGHKRGATKSNDQIEREADVQMSLWGFNPLT